MAEFSDEVLKSVIAGTASTDIVQKLELALEHSTELQARLERLSGFVEIRESGSALRSTLPPNSPELERAIERLKREPHSQAEARELEEFATNTGSFGSSLLTPGGKVEQIEVRRLLGRGAMGEVFEGYDTQLDRRVCLKVMSPHLLGSDVATERLLREAQSAAQLQHENVVAIFGILKRNGSPILVQQFVPGETLTRRLERSGQLGAEELIALAEQLARGLSAAHSLDIIHRDLKPDNILLDEAANIARIADFGLARRGGRSMLTQEGIVAGTPAYMSPEQTRGDELDSRSDLFSLGVVLHTAATGTNPFDADDPYVAMDRVRIHVPPALGQIRPELPETFCRAVDQLLAKTPDDRLASAEEFLERISPRRSRLTAAKAETRDSSKLRWAIAIIVLAIAGTGGEMLRRSGRQPAAELASVPVPDIDGVAESSTTATQTANTAPTRQSPGFVLQQSNRRFETLEEAITQAAENDTIEVHGDGPFYCGSIEIFSGGLTIRAAEGSRPEFRPEQSDTQSQANFLTARSGLHLEGITIHWPVPGTRNIQVEDLGQNAVVCFTGGDVRVKNCRIVSGERAMAVGLGNASLTVENTEIDAVGWGIVWLMYHTRVELRNCWFKGMTAITVSPNLGRFSSGGSRELVIDRCTFDTERLIGSLLMDTDDTPLQVTLARSVLNVDYAATIVAMPRFQRDIQAPLGLIHILRQVMRVNERECIHKKGCVYLAGMRGAQPGRMFPSNVSDIEDWNLLWKAEATGSVTAEIVPPANSSSNTTGRHEFRNAARPIPKDCGVDFSQIGSLPRQ